MNATTIRKRLVAKFIIAEFANGNICTQKDVNNIISMVVSKLGMTRVQAACFFRSCIAL